MKAQTTLAPVAEPTTPPASGRHRMRPSVGLRLALMGLVALAACTGYLLYQLPWGVDFLVQRRLVTLGTMCVVAVAIGVATVLFHTVTANRILTPSIMGLDSLYVALQTASVFFLGTIGFGEATQYLIVLASMVGFALLLFTMMLVKLNRSVTLMVLVGVLLGGLFRGLSTFMQRLLDPDAFQVLSDRMFADFTGTRPQLLGISAVIVALATGFVWLRRRELDVVALGRDVAIGLGVNHRRASLVNLVVVALLVGTATALVGPTMFFGLLVAHLGYRMIGSHLHQATLPAVALLGIITLVGGQVLFERVLGFEGSLSMVVEFVGGITFLVLLLRSSRAGRPA
ncbi:iron chelate uptake ABC transporter family permease subunit [Luteococcus sp. H138]|uniref:iron chelate uptake ABC transporter family permease subunit n=1 Tax=unclassified Luteococcus TaxID=2639923 RepID=UPI00313ED4E7